MLRVTAVAAAKRHIRIIPAVAEALADRRINSYIGIEYMKIHKGDNVKVISGKDRGKTGKVLRALPREDMVIVEGVHVQKRHEKANKSTKQGGGIVEVAAPIHVSNVQLLDPKTQKPTRVGVKRDEAKKKNVRVAKKSGTTLK